MLTNLSGSTHSVFTGVSVVYTVAGMTVSSIFVRKLICPLLDDEFSIVQREHQFHAETEVNTRKFTSSCTYFHVNHVCVLLLFALFS